MHQSQKKSFNWHVSDKLSMLDHYQICFDIEKDLQKDTTYRYPQSTSWNMKRDILSDSMRENINTIKTIYSIEIAVDTLTSAIINAYEESCPIRILQSNRKVSWWSSTLTKLRKRSRQLFNRAKRTNQWDEYKNALTKYKCELRKAKRKSWRQLCEEVENTPTAARLHKIMSKEPTNKVG